MNDTGNHQVFSITSHKQFSAFNFKQCIGRIFHIDASVEKELFDSMHRSLLTAARFERLDADVIHRHCSR